MTITEPWNRVQGDINDTLVVTLDGVADLGGVTAVEGHVVDLAHPDDIVDLTAAVTDPDTRRVTVNLSPWLETATPGWWALEVETVWASGETLTFPEGRKPRIYVRPQLA